METPPLVLRSTPYISHFCSNRPKMTGTLFVKRYRHVNEIKMLQRTAPYVLKHLQLQQHFLLQVYYGRNGGFLFDPNHRSLRTDSRFLSFRPFSFYRQKQHI